MELPLEFKERMRKLWGQEEFARYEESFHAERKYGLRVNVRKISTQEFERKSPFPLKKVPWISNGYFYDGKQDSPAKHPYYHAGLYYLQEPSAMTPAECLPVEKGDFVLDLCAAPGGKATELSSKLGGTGLLVANDVSASRAKGLLKNLELFGADNALVVNELPEKLAERFPAFFDKILIDAPCSGEGMFRKDPAIMKSWEKKGPLEFAKIQEQIVRSAVTMLKPGGKLLYSTCTFAPEENEGTISRLLEENPDLEVLELPSYEGFSHGRPEWLPEGYVRYESLRRAVRIFPQNMDGEGHFICLLGKEGSAGPSARETQGPYVKNQEFEEFLTLLTKEYDPGRFTMHSDRIYLVPEGIGDLRGLHVLRCGLLFGECRKNRFEPSQALAMSLSREDCRNVIDLELEDVRLTKYLKGETIDVEDLVEPGAKGWFLICGDGFSLGWGKVVSGTLKNKYHAGWRLA